MTAIAFPAADAIARTLARARTVLRGPELRKIRLDHPDLQSPDPDRDTPSDGAAPHSHRWRVLNAVAEVAIWPLPIRRYGGRTAVSTGQLSYAQNWLLWAGED